MKLTRKQFEALALEHLDTLYRLARRLVRDPGRAEDLVQETYLRAVRSWQTFTLDERYGIRPWLVRILHNVHVTRGQQDARQPRPVDGEALDALTGQEPNPSPDLPDFDVLDERLAHALEDLPVEYQSVLLLWAVEEFSYKEIADALDVPIGTVMSRLHRARQRMAGPLQDLAREQRFVRGGGTE